MNIYEYRQNNSGGTYHIDHERGISRIVLIEAESPARANHHAESIGLYFDGAGDCQCCGDRWYEASEYDVVVPDDDHTDLNWLVALSGTDRITYLHKLDGTFAAA
jgi:hypothetical protein